MQPPLAKQEATGRTHAGQAAASADDQLASLGRCLHRCRPRPQRQIARDLGIDPVTLYFLVPLSALVGAFLATVPVLLLLLGLELLQVPVVGPISIVAMSTTFVASYGFLLWYSWGRHPGYLHLYEHGLVCRRFFRKRTIRYDDILRWGSGRPLRWHQRWFFKINRYVNPGINNVAIRTFNNCLTFTLRDASVVSLKNLLATYPAEAVELLLETLNGLNLNPPDDTSRERREGVEKDDR